MQFFSPFQVRIFFFAKKKMDQELSNVDKYSSHTQMNGDEDNADVWNACKWDEDMRDIYESLDTDLPFKGICTDNSTTILCGEHDVGTLQTSMNYELREIRGIILAPPPLLPHVTEIVQHNCKFINSPPVLPYDNILPSRTFRKKKPTATAAPRIAHSSEVITRQRRVIHKRSVASIMRSRLRQLKFVPTTKAEAIAGMRRSRNVATTITDTDSASKTIQREQPSPFPPPQQQQQQSTLWRRNVEVIQDKSDETDNYKAAPSAVPLINFKYNHAIYADEVEDVGILQPITESIFYWKQGCNPLLKTDMRRIRHFDFRDQIIKEGRDTY